MAKKKELGKTLQPPPKQLVNGMHEASQLMEEERWVEARLLLNDLAKKYPKNPYLLGMLAEVCFELQDMEAYQYALERLSSVDPDDPEILLALAGTCMVNIRPASAIQHFRNFLRRWPDHESADDARKSLTKMEEHFSEEVDKWGFDLEEAIRLGLQNESAQSMLATGRHRQAILIGNKVIKKHQDFVPAYNNLSQAYWLNGNLENAISVSEKAIGIRPENVHALSNLVRYSILEGEIDKAHNYATRLKESQEEAVDREIKLVEAFAFLGEDEEVLAILQRTETLGDIEKSGSISAFAFHLAGAASMRLGDERNAKRYWKKALEIDENFGPALDNLADLKRPIGERHAPWSFPLYYWVNNTTVSELNQFIAAPAKHKDEGGIIRATQKFLEKYPNLNQLAPRILEFGDEHSREFVLALARFSESSELMQAAKDFALGQRGPDQLRMEIAQVVSQSGLLAPGMTKIWLEGRWTEVLLLGIKIHSEITIHHNRKVVALIQKGIEEIYEGDGQKAEQTFKKALAIEPESPDILYNLAGAHQLQKQDEESEDLILDIYKRFPDYLFGKIGMAHVFLKRGEKEQARMLLDSMLDVESMHLNEFDAFCAENIECYLGENDRKSARSWFGIWESIDPENPKLESYRFRVSGWKSTLDN